MSDYIEIQAHQVFITDRSNGTQVDVIALGKRHKGCYYFEDNGQFYVELKFKGEKYKVYFEMPQ